MLVEGNIATLLNGFAIASISFILANIAVSAVVSVLAQKFLKLQLNSRKTILWLLVLLPWLTGAAVSVFFVFGSVTSSPFVAESEYAHWQHMNSFSWLSWHGLILAFAALFIAYVLLVKFTQLRKHATELNLLKSLSHCRDGNIYEVELAQASAFTAGILNKQRFITTGMLAQTSAQEQQVILQHEQAHAEANDPFKKWLFSIFASFFLPMLAARLKLLMTLAMEQQADKRVLDYGYQSTFVASTLVKVASLNANESPVKNNELVANFGADILEQRVFFLLGQLDLKPVNKLLTLLLIILILGGSVGSIDSIHHLMEKLFSH